MLFFDLDGTLIDSNGIWERVDRTFLSRRGLPYTRAYYEGVAHTIFPLAAAFTKSFCGLSESCEEIMAEWMDLADGLYSDVPLKPGVRELLDAYRARGERMAVVTSSVPEHCRTALDHLGIAAYFECVIFAQDLGLEKKDPALWGRAAELCGVDPEACTVFDDSLSACKGAKAAGMRTVGVWDRYFAADEGALREFCDGYVKSFEDCRILWIDG